jgi:hypothetical protein
MNFNLFLCTMHSNIYYILLFSLSTSNAVVNIYKEGECKSRYTVFIMKNIIVLLSHKKDDIQNAIKYNLLSAQITYFCNPPPPYITPSSAVAFCTYIVELFLCSVWFSK